MRYQPLRFIRVHVLKSTRNLLRGPTGLEDRDDHRQQRRASYQLTPSAASAPMRVTIRAHRVVRRRRLVPGNLPGHRARTTTQALRNLPTAHPRVQAPLNQVAVINRQLFVSSCHVLTSLPSEKVWVLHFNFEPAKL